MVCPTLHRISTTTSGKLTLGALRGSSTSETTPLSQDDLLATCSILCTADYCLDTTQQLESKLKEKVNQDLVERIHFTSETEAFHG